MVEAEAARICCDRDTLRKVRHEPSAVAAQRAAQTSLTSSAQRIERRLRHFRQVTAGDRQVLLCAIQAVAYALSFDHAVEAWQAGAESKVRAFAGILAERIEGAGSAPSQSGMRLV